VFQNPLENFGASGSRRIDIPVIVPNGLDLDRAERIAMAAVETVQGRDTSRAVDAFYDAFGGDSIAFTLRFWIAFHNRESEFLAARGEAVKRIKHAFDREAANRNIGAGTLGSDPCGRAFFTGWGLPP